jgi:hypothetical protein
MHFAHWPIERLELDVSDKLSRQFPPQSDVR